MAIRERVMVRDCGLCQTCLRNGLTTIGSQVDHIVALTNGGGNDDSNLECICLECHSAKSLLDLGLKPQITTGIDGWPIDSKPLNIRAIWRINGYK